MNVTAFSLKFYQHDIVPWCSHSQQLDLICALLRNLLQEGLGSNSAKSLQMRKVIPNTAYRPEPFNNPASSVVRAWGSTTHPGKIVWKWWPFPNFTWPRRQCLISLCYSESRWTTGKETRDLLKTQLLLLSLDFPGQYISNFFPPIERRENLTLPHSVLQLAPVR